MDIELSILSSLRLHSNTNIIRIRELSEEYHSDGIYLYQSKLFLNSLNLHSIIDIIQIQQLSDKYYSDGIYRYQSKL